MQDLFNWCMQHQAAVGIASTVLALVIGWALPNDKVVKAGFFVSQFVRRVAGKKLEDKIEEAADGFVKGMKGDNAGGK